LDEDLKPAQELLKKLERRQIYPCIGKSWSKRLEDANEKHKRIDEFLCGKLQPNEYFIRKYEMHQGLGLHEHPLDKLCFFNAKNPDKKSTRLSFHRVSFSLMV
jgi:hypothetical protein